MIEKITDEVLKAIVSISYIAIFIGFAWKMIKDFWKENNRD